MESGELGERWMYNTLRDLIKDGNYKLSCELLRETFDNDRLVVIQKLLELAIEDNNDHIVKLIFDEKLDPNYLDINSVSPLNFAITEKHPNIVLIILQAGSDPNMQYNLQYT